MKKSILFLLIFPLWLLACSDSGDKGKGTGNLRIGGTVNSSTVSAETRTTPTDNFSTYTVTLQGAQSLTYPYPSEGILTDIPAGEYTVTMASHGSMSAPAFETPYYKGSNTCTVKAGGTDGISITMTQANAGIFFVYDSTIDDAGYDVVPTVTSSEGSLEYSGADKQSRGYFAPGEVNLTFKVDGAPATLNNGNLDKLALSEQQLWKVTLFVDGSVGITAVVEVIDTPTNEISFYAGFAEIYAHGEAYIVQESSAADAVDPVHLVVIGDGFVMQDYAKGGHFDTVTDEAIEGFSWWSRILPTAIISR